MLTKLTNRKCARKREFVERKAAYCNPVDCFTFCSTERDLRYFANYNLEVNLGG